MAESDACLFGSFHLNENVSLGMKSHDFTQIFSVALILLAEFTADPIEL